MRRRMISALFAYPKDLAFEWLATIVLVGAVALNSWNVYPLNLWIGLVGNALWLVLGFMWRKWSLCVVQAIISAIYVAGLLHNQIG